MPIRPAAARPARLPSGSARLALGADQRGEAVVVLVTHGTALQVRSHARDRRVGVSSGELELELDAGRRCRARVSSNVT